MTPPRKIYSYKDNQALDKDIKQIYDWLSKDDVTTTAPNGSRQGRVGERVLYNNAGTFELWVNTDGSTVWQQIT